MATETTKLLSGFIVDVPKDDDLYEALSESQKVKSLSLEELMPFQDDPWWQNVRRTFFFSFWITLILTFTSACVLSVLRHGSCEAMKTEASNSSTSTIVGPIITLSTLISTSSS